MTLRHMNVFVHVYESKGITAAARSMHISQPAVSVAIKELEAHYGVRLFERYSRRLKVTPAGETLYHYASQMVSNLEEIESALLAWDEVGMLRIGMNVTAGAQVMAPIIEQYRSNYPKVQLHMVTANRDRIEEGILNNRLDLAVIGGNIHSDLIVAERFMQDELGVFCASNHPLAKKREVTLSALANEDLLLREVGSGTREFIENVFAVQGIRIAPVWESACTQTLVRAAALGLGVTILPTQTVQGYLDRDKLNARPP